MRAWSDSFPSAQSASWRSPSCTPLRGCCRSGFAVAQDSVLVELDVEWHSLAGKTWGKKKLYVSQLCFIIWKKTTKIGWSPSKLSRNLKSLLCFATYYRAYLLAHRVKNLPALWETWVQSLDWEDPPENRTATHSNILAWIIPWTL